MFKNLRHFISKQFLKRSTYFLKKRNFEKSIKYFGLAFKIGNSEEKKLLSDYLAYLRNN